jgi:hypothetical protein
MEIEEYRGFTIHLAIGGLYEASNPDLELCIWAESIDELIEEIDERWE